MAASRSRLKHIEKNVIFVIIFFFFNIVIEANKLGSRSMDTILAPACLGSYKSTATHKNTARLFPEWNGINYFSVCKELESD